MAGHGAYHGDADMFAADPAGAAAGYGATSAGGMLHERPRYTYGQDRGQADDNFSEVAHGAYSSQPQAQVAYNPEAYGSYAVYDADTSAAGGYQEATREYQGQSQLGHAQGGYDNQYGQYDNYVVADPGPASHAGPAPIVRSTSGANPTSRDPAPANTSRAQNARSIVDDDVYGGI